MSPSLSQPKRKYKNITVVIRTIDVKTEDIVSEIVRNIDSPERRKWLQEALIKACMWAMFNGKYIEVINKEDDVE